MAFILPTDIIGIEIKSDKDVLTRLERQSEEFSRALPEWWIATGAKHERIVRDSGYWHAGQATVADGKVEIRSKPIRDEFVIPQMLKILWAAEAAMICERMRVWPGARQHRAKLSKMLPMLARLLTGNEIIREVCTELRARPAFGAMSDPPMR